MYKSIIIIITIIILLPSLVGSHFLQAPTIVLLLCSANLKTQTHWHGSVKTQEAIITSPELGLFFFFWGGGAGRVFWGPFVFHYRAKKVFFLLGS